MSAGWESLGDWLVDQARELGHIVRPAPKPRPVPVPSLEDMPLTESVPVCDIFPEHPHAATTRVVVHVSCPHSHKHGNTLFLMCEEHWTNYREYIEDELARFAPWQCSGCERIIRQLSDAVLTVIPL